MRQLIFEMPGSENKDIPRLIARVEELISQNKIRNYKNFEKTKGKVEIFSEGEEKKRKGGKKRVIDLKNDSSFETEEEEEVKVRVKKKK